MQVGRLRFKHNLAGTRWRMAVLGVESVVEVQRVGYSYFGDPIVTLLRVDPDAPKGHDADGVPRAAVYLTGEQCRPFMTSQDNRRYP